MASNLKHQLCAPSLENIQLAAKNIASKAIRTPLVRLNCPFQTPQIYLKLENLQPIGSFKVRPAANAIFNITDKEALKTVGVCTASAGNFAQGLAWCCSEMKIPCTVVAPSHAPHTKLEAIRRWGAKVILVPYSDWWQVIQSHECPQAPGSLFIHPGAENDVLAGNATIALEILEDLPDVDCIVAPYGSGSLCTGIASGVKAVIGAGGKCREVTVMAVEPDTAAPFALSKKMGKPCKFEAWEASFVDGCGGKSVLEEIWEVAKDVIDGGCSVSVEAVADAVRMLAENNRVIAEGAGACAVAAALGGLCGPKANKIVCVVSGGGIDTDKLVTILQGKVPKPESPKMGFDDRVESLGLDLPFCPEPKGCYTPAVITGNMIYLSGHGPVLKDGKRYVMGKVGTDLTVEEGVAAARRTGLAALATLRYKLGSLDRVKRIVKTLGMVNADPGIVNKLECVQIVNGFSKLMVEVFGEAEGVGARSAVAVAMLPMNTPVEIEAIFEIHA